MEKKDETRYDVMAVDLRQCTLDLFAERKIGELEPGELKLLRQALELVPDDTETEAA